MNITVEEVDYHNAQQGRHMARLLDYYARDPMGGGQALDDDVINKLAAELAKIPHAFSVLSYVDEQPAGLVNCFEVFSTFKCRPLVNIHDVVVMKEYRGLGLSLKMLNKVEQIARSRNCCKLTLEVLQGNTPAQQAYRKFGFSDYQLDPSQGKAMFWEKIIDASEQ